MWRRNVRVGGLLLAMIGLSSAGISADSDPRPSGSLTLMGFGPEYAVYVTRVGDASLAAYMTRAEDGPARLEWSVGLVAQDFLAEPRSVTLTSLPDGKYNVRWWNGQVRAVGKTLLSGVGATRQVVVGERPEHVTLEAPVGIAAPTRLNVVWGRVGAPDDVSVYVDDVYIGHAFHSAELSVFGLRKGARRVRIAAAGYRPVDLYVTLSTQVETTRFVQMRRLGRED
jgi:hypothetical protein